MTQTAPASLSTSELKLPAQFVPDHLCFNSNDILQGKKVVDIQHNGATYKLQETRSGKLILTK